MTVLPEGRGRKGGFARGWVIKAKVPKRKTILKAWGLHENRDQQPSYVRRKRGSWVENEKSVRHSQGTGRWKKTNSAVYTAWAAPMRMKERKRQKMKKKADEVETIKGG